MSFTEIRQDGEERTITSLSEVSAVRSAFLFAAAVGNSGIIRAIAVLIPMSNVNKTVISISAVVEGMAEGMTAFTGHMVVIVFRQVTYVTYWGMVPMPTRPIEGRLALAFNTNGGNSMER